MVSRMNTMMLAGASLAGALKLQLQLDTDLSADVAQKTAQGCTCLSICAATSEDHFNCDRCETEPGCGEDWGDYCVYPANEELEARNHSTKTEDLWRDITADTTRGSFPDGALPALFTQSSQTVFNVWSDEIPEGRVRNIHSVASYCKVGLEIADDSPYTGLLAKGYRHGVIRMGSGTAANATVDPLGLKAGIGLKMPRTNRHSGNLLAMHSIESTGWNFFKNNMSNHIPISPTAAGALQAKFVQASQCVTHLGLSDLARYSQDGTEIDYPKFPFKLFLVPGADVQMDENPKTEDELHYAMKFGEGTTLFTLYACDTPVGDEMHPTEGSVEAACGSPVLLGEMVTTAQCTTSAYGDAKMQIRHQRIEEDWELRPEILDQYNATQACGAFTTVSVDATPAKCAE